MCGIVGYTGREQAGPILLDGLEHLEYRGYDSAGIAVLSPEKGLQVRKAKGRLKVLAALTDGGKSLGGTMGVGHTRWATHGEPNDVNSHPHLSEDERIAVVHNGIIENYVELKSFLVSTGVSFRSETDTEVVAQLLGYYYKRCGNILDAVYRVLDRIEGAYALGILCADLPESFIAARKDAPLLLGYGEGCHFIASDVTAIIKHTRDVAYMEDGEVAVVSPDGIVVYNALGAEVEKEHHTVDWDVSDAEKGGYAHFMFKEIMEQPEAIRKTISPRIRERRIVFDELKMSPEELRSFNKLYIVACGSSYHVGMVGKYNLERLLRMQVDIALASEFRYAEPLVDEKTLVIVISQSGETLDTMAALRKAKSLGARILSIVNVVGSSIARESDDVLYTWAGPEIAARAAGHVRDLSRGAVREAHAGELRRARRRAAGAAGQDGERAGGHRDDQVSRLALLQPRFDLLHRPQPRLRARPRGQSQAQGDLLRPLRGLRRGRAQARHDLADRGRDAGRGAVHLQGAL